MTGATDHPCQGRPVAQVRAFEMIAVNQHPRCKPATIAALVEAGLVTVSYQRRRDKLGVYEVPTYAVPYWAHRQWCAWAAEAERDAVHG